MDYSSLPTDPDHPAGTSPWQSSPQPNSRPSFTATESGRVSSTLTRDSSYSSPSQRRSEVDVSDQEALGDEFYRQQSVGNGTSHENGASPQTSQSLRPSTDDGFQQQQHPQHQHQHQQQQQPQQNRHPQSQQQQSTTGPNRYHGTARQAQRQTLPQYKLQAKIIGLERTGRKDPILKFMVHVRCEKCSFKFQI